MTTPLFLFNEPLPSREQLFCLWTDLNACYFRGRLPPIDIEWSERLTASSGLFVSRLGPRTAVSDPSDRRPRRLIRLSLPLLRRLASRSAYAEQEVVNTLAHEMIHQWQYDILKQRPDHGLVFLRKLREVNRDGQVGVSLYHSLGDDVLALSRYRWRCQVCGKEYRRTRRTIRPSRHRCGVCRGSLEEVRRSHESPTESRLTAGTHPSL